MTAPEAADQGCHKRSMLEHAAWVFRLARIGALVSVCFLLVGVPANAQTDPLPEWDGRAAKSAIVDFVGRVTKEGRPDFVPLAERIAVFDNDGTLWAEQPNNGELDVEAV
jgi:hypothetical protein